MDTGAEDPLLTGAGALPTPYIELRGGLALGLLIMEFGIALVTRDAMEEDTLATGVTTSVVVPWRDRLAGETVPSTAMLAFMMGVVVEARDGIVRGVRVTVDSPPGFG